MWIVQGFVIAGMIIAFMYPNAFIDFILYLFFLVFGVMWVADYLGYGTNEVFKNIFIYGVALFFVVKFLNHIRRRGI